jgi:hypothetical protein
MELLAGLKALVLGVSAVDVVVTGGCIVLGTYGVYKFVRYLYPNECRVGGTGDPDRHVVAIHNRAIAAHNANQGQAPCGGSGGPSAQPERGSSSSSGVGMQPRTQPAHTSHTSHTELALNNSTHVGGGSRGSGGGLGQ